jgi:methionyl-tRNA formyltransferase
VRIVALPTYTQHHAYWAFMVASAGVLGGVVPERRRAQAPFATRHAFEDERDAFEREALAAPAWSELAPVEEVDTVDDATLTGDFAVSFGTGLIGPALIERWSGRLLNLHGGDPERYRGLDTHLWAVYHGDFDGLVTTLHVVDERLDTGAVVEKAAIPLPDELYQLRAANTEVCVELTLGAVERRAATPQRAVGRYYSFMPAVLKDVCLQRWAKRTVPA